MTSDDKTNASQIQHRIKQVMATVFKVPIDEILDEASAHSLSNWDSLNHFNLVTSLEKEFKIRLEDDEIATLTTYKMIVNTVLAHLE